jgi:hypothetical protein
MLTQTIVRLNAEVKARIEHLSPLAMVAALGAASGIALG